MAATHSRKPGPGRPKGSASKRSQEALQLAEEKGVDPVAMLLDLTKWAYSQFKESPTKDSADMVRDYAREAAPYVSPKLAAIDMKAQVEDVRRVVSDEPVKGEDWEAEWVPGKSGLN